MALTRVTRLPGVVAQPRFGTIPLTPPSVPGPVRNLAALSATYSGAILSWEVPITGGLPTGWRGRYSKDNGSTWSAAQTLAASPAAIALPDASTAYLVEVVALNLSGQGLWSAPIAVATQDAPVAPDAPTALLASTIRRTSFVASWTDPAQGPATSFNLRWRVGAGAWTTLTGFAKGAAVTGLTAGSAIEWQVQGANDVGAGPWSASQTTNAAAEFALPAVAGTPVANIVDWRNMMEGVTASRKNWATGAQAAVVGTPTMSGGGTRLKGGTNYLPAVNEVPTQTYYVVGKLVAPITSNGDRPVFIGSRASATNIGATMYPAANGTPAAIDVRQYVGYSDTTNSGATAGVATLDLSGFTILRGQSRDGVGVSFADITHNRIGTPVANVKARQIGANQPLNWGHAGVAGYAGEVIEACGVVVNGVPTVDEDAAIVAKIRSEMAYWGVAEGS